MKTQSQNNPGTWEPEAGKSGVPGQPRLHSEPQKNKTEQQNEVGDSRAHDGPVLKLSDHSK